MVEGGAIRLSPPSTHLCSRKPESVEDTPMMRVTIEIVPGGYEPRARVIERIEIRNMSPLDAEVADYLIDTEFYIAHKKANGPRVLAAKCLMKVDAHRKRESLELTTPPTDDADQSDSGVTSNG